MGKGGPSHTRFRNARDHLVMGLVWGGLLAIGFSVLLLAMQLVQALAEPAFGLSFEGGVSELPVPSRMLAYLVGGTTAGVVLSVLLRYGHGASS